MIDIYRENSTSPAVLRYEQRCDSDWKKLYFEFAFGQKSYEAYFVMMIAWIVAIVGFYAMRGNPLKGMNWPFCSNIAFETQNQPDQMRSLFVPILRSR
jgi:hypothetical protein